MSRRWPLALLLLLLLAPACTDHSLDGARPTTRHFVAVTGTPQGDGSRESPWDLTTALAGANGAVQPGDTIWVRGGTYVGAVVSGVAGEPDRPVVIRAVPGERAIIDGRDAAGDTFIVRGAWTVVWGLEVTNSAPDRTTARPDGVVNDAPHTRYVNLVIHDTGIAFFTFPRHADVEVYGAIIYNVGWDEATRANGHALYLKSDAGPLVVRDNVVFQQFGYGIHAYSDRGSGRIVGLVLEGNVAFDNGVLAPVHPGANMVIGGVEPADDVLAHGNLLYYTPGLTGPNAEIGFQWHESGTIHLRENVFVGGDPVLNVGPWRQTLVEHNLITGDGLMVSFRDSTPLGMQWTGNRYLRDPLASAWSFLGVRLPLAAWQTLTLLGATDSAAAVVPRESTVWVRPNRYEPGRATVAVVNWSGAPGVTLDLFGVLAPADSFEVHNVQDLWGPPVAAGAYQGTVTIPFGGVAPPPPVGLPVSPAPRTGPAFDVFVIRRVRAAEIF